jgi:predicted DCC family thiol-disulfide oxidoreductase YuxK
MCRVVGGWWRVFQILWLIPLVLRDWGYDFVARHRYRWFGKVAYCQLIPEDLRVTLLDPPSGEGDAHRAA